MDTRQIHGAMFAGADLIVASPPCQEFSYRAQPWKRAKAQTPKDLKLSEPEWWGKPQSDMTISERDEWEAWKRCFPALRPLLGIELFWQCWRIQHEACEAAGRYIPLVAENVKGAQPWLGRAKGRYGSFYLWGDVESVGGRLVRSGPIEFGMASVAAARRIKSAAGSPGKIWSERDPASSWSGTHGVDGQKVHGFNFHQHENGGKGGSFQSAAVAANVGKNPEGRNQKQPVWFNDDKRRAEKCGGDWFGSGTDCSLMRRMSSKYSARKAASAQIAKIPEPLSRHIARVFKPDL